MKFLYIQELNLKSWIVIEDGAIWCDDIKSCAKDKDVIITIVGLS